MGRLLNIETDDIDPALQEEFGDSTLLLGSVGGRYIDVDRPTVIERTHGHRRERDLREPGRSRRVRSAGRRRDRRDVPPDAAQRADSRSRTRCRSGSERVKVVGIGVFADEVLPDDLYTTVKVIFSPQLTAKYSCVTKQPGPDDPRSIDELNGSSSRMTAPATRRCSRCA